MYKKSIFWFRQDFRVQDNTGLYECVQNSEQILPIFILDSTLIDGFWWLSDQKFWFIREAMEALSSNIRTLWGDGVVVLLGNPQELVPKLVKMYDIDAVFCNKSYGSYGTYRDSKIHETLSTLGCEMKSFADFLLVEPHEVEQRKVFTPFFKLWLKKVPDVFPSRPICVFSQLKTPEKLDAVWDYIPLAKHPFFTLQFGRERLEHSIRPDYEATRNTLDIDGTSKLSVYLRFGVFSVREIYQRAKQVSSVYVSELAWREFWWHIFHYFPETKKQEFQEKRRHIVWSQDTKMFEKWCLWETGYPLVDAAMKQLNTTNWMHGRARMVVASFLTKDMHIDWRLWEQYFKQKLLDYDEAVNLGNWQWSASVWADPKPLRVFSPMLQSEKFDPQTRFIQKYLPMLEGESIDAIHNPLENKLWYISPIVDHRVETHRARELYKSWGSEV